ncbi:hypothetical protein C0J52_27789 [Blattella germanica]|nr:hypothetical protein C0J52_27789 [Blattella germanica]
MFTKTSSSFALASTVSSSLAGSSSLSSSSSRRMNIAAGSLPDNAVPIKAFVNCIMTATQQTNPVVIDDLSLQSLVAACCRVKVLAVLDSLPPVGIIPKGMLIYCLVSCHVCIL